MIDPVLAGRMTYVLGITNLVGLGLVYFSCRCLVGNRFVERMVKYAWYRKFYQGHCRWWYLFFISVFLHSVLALVTFGNPLF